eukprot:8997797-Pyramimonas_sp.AAC.1
MRLLLFHRPQDGTYSATRKSKAKPRATKIAVSRIMVASARMRLWNARGGGGAAMPTRAQMRSVWRTCI